jgi:uncharacterized protein YeaO (DUF488 family)
VLVDRLWPRGLAKDAAAIDEWARAAAPSDELRRWCGHEPRKFTEFRRRYHDELQKPEPAKALQHLREPAETGTITLLTAHHESPDRHDVRAHSVNAAAILVSAERCL